MVFHPQVRKQSQGRALQLSLGPDASRGRTWLRWVPAWSLWVTAQGCSMEGPQGPAGPGELPRL